MNQVFYQNLLLKFIRSKKGKALDLASGNETFVKLLLKNNWYVDSVDLKKIIILIKKIIPSIVLI